LAEHVTNWIPFDKVFDDEPSPDHLKEVLGRMNFESVLYRLALTNGITSAFDIGGQKDIQSLALNQIALSDEVKARINEYFLSTANPWVLQRRGLLELLKWSALYSIDGESHERTDDFLFSTMCAAELATPRHDSLLAGSPSDSSLLRIKKSLPAVREMALFGYPAWYALHSLGRAKIILLDDMFQNDGFEAEFVKNTSSTSRQGLSLADFYTCVAGVACMGLGAGARKAGEYLFHFTIDNLCAGCPEFRPKLETFFEHFSISPDFIRKQLKKMKAEEFFDFKLFRQRPILRLSDGRFILLDRIFFQDMMACGPMFKILNLDTDNRVFGEFGNSFERYCYKVVSYHHGRMKDRNIENGVLSRNRQIVVDSHKTAELCDISVSYENSLVMIEAKGVWLRDDKLKPMDYEIFWEELSSKYGVAEGHRDKGVGQLARSIKYLADGLKVHASTAESTIDNSSLERIFPVLLVHDSLLHAEGFIPAALAGEFAILMGLEDAPANGWFYYQGASHRFQVMNLVIISITDLERLVAAKINNFSWLGHLKKYASQDPKRGNITFDLYIQTAFKNWFDSNRFLPAEPAQELMKEAGKILLA
jgi:hypothetical protein